METEETPQWRKPKLSHEASNSQFQLSTFNVTKQQSSRLLERLQEYENSTGGQLTGIYSGSLLAWSQVFAALSL